MSWLDSSYARALPWLQTIAPRAAPSLRRTSFSIVEEEADESQFWLEILAEASLLPSERLTRLASEANQLISIVVASKKTARRNLAS